MRRNTLSEMTLQEEAIYDAITAVETLPADYRLTNCVMKLQEAKNHLGNYVDGLDEAPQTAPEPPKEETFLDRLIKEKEDLKTKKDALRSFLDSDKISIVSDVQRKLLKKQWYAMDEYYNLLNLRIADLEK